MLLTAPENGGDDDDALAVTGSRGREIASNNKSICE